MGIIFGAHPIIIPIPTTGAIRIIMAGAMDITIREVTGKTIGRAKG